MYALLLETLPGFQIRRFKACSATGVFVRLRIPEILYCLCCEQPRRRSVCASAQLIRAFSVRMFAMIRVLPRRGAIIVKRLGAYLKCDIIIIIQLQANDIPLCCNYSFVCHSKGYLVALVDFFSETNNHLRKK